MVPFDAFFHYLLDSHRKDFATNLFFVLLVFGGGLFLIIGSILGIDFAASKIGTLFLMYLVLWIAWILWVFDLIFGLPWGWDRHTVVPVFFALSAGVFSFCEFCSYVKDRWAPLERGYRRCPFCRAVIVELSIECPHCRNKV